MSNQQKLDEARSQKGLMHIEQQIAAIETQITTQVAAQSTESVEVPNWGTFYRRSDGWHGPGGFYGPSTPMAKKCEEISEANKENKQ
jgi:hypothetical protein